MNASFSSAPALGRRVRLAALLLAVGCVSFVQGTLLGLFDSASPQRWLAPTPLVLQAKAQCDALADRADRLRCAQALVARGLGGAESNPRVAAR